MTYTIHCRWMDRGKERFIVEKATAKEALAEAENLQRSDVQIEYIDAPGEPHSDMQMLRVLAREEGSP